MNPIISLVSGTYNRLESLKDMIDSFRTNMPLGLPYEIVLVDGGSTDGTIDWCKSQADVKLIEHGELKGAIIAFTEGAFTAQGKFVLLANDDITFFDNSILPAIVHMEQTAKCGAVAFKDNRPLPPTYTEKDYKVLTFPQVIRGKMDYLPYAQVGLFRKWIGDYCHWWAGRENEMLKPGLVYGGDNMLSTYIWSLGYSVDTVETAKVHDSVMEDGLRVINRERGIKNNDSKYYYDRWPNGAVVPDMPVIAQQDTQGARFLYLPIYEPGWTIQHDPVMGKHGLRDALARSTNKHGAQSLVWEIDYLSIPRDKLKDELVTACKTFKPHFILTQIQAPVPLTVDILDAMRTACNHQCAIINWNGDYAIGGLTSPEMLKILHRVDLQLVVNALALDTYQAQAIKAAYWQIGFEDVPDELLPDMPSHDVVWLANLYNDNRREVDKVLRKFDYVCYQAGDSFATLYDFGKAKKAYQQAKIAISNNDYPNQSAFVSNRLFQSLAAGNCVVFQQQVIGLSERTGLQAGTHFIEWQHNEELPSLITHWLDPAHETERQAIAAAGTAFVREYHSFDHRVKELFDLMRQHLSASQVATETVTLRYIGKSSDGAGGWPSVVYERPYEHHSGLLTVHKRDAELMLQHRETWVEA